MLVAKKTSQVSFEVKQSRRGLSGAQVKYNLGPESQGKNALCVVQS